MNKIYVLLILSLFTPYYVFPQLYCSSGNSPIQSQEDVNAFQSNCVYFLGDLTIDGANIPNGETPIHNLQNLSTIEIISGALTIQNTSELSSLSDLSSLFSLNGLVIKNNPNLTDCSLIEFCESSSSSDFTIELDNNGTACSNENSITQNCTSCLKEGITFITQQEIDDFLIQYPNCTKILGDIEIDGLMSAQSYGTLPPVTNLNSLQNITEIEGNLYIYTTEELTSLEGLDNLQSIKGYLQLYDNNALLSIANLSQLNYIGKELSIWGNGHLSSLQGLENITTIHGYWLSISGGKFTDLSGLENLTHINGELVLEDNWLLNNLNGLQNLTHVGGRLSITGNTKLQNVDALQNLKSIDGLMYISNNSTLTDISGLSNIPYQDITNLTITNNENLSTCSIKNVCEYLTYNSGNYNISYNAETCNSKIEVINACEPLAPPCLSNGITLTTQQEVNDFSANHEGCTEILGDVIITDSAIDLISNLNGLSQLRIIRGNLTIEGLNNLQNFVGLELLKQVDGEVRISSNTALNNMVGLNNLSKIGDNFTIENHAVLNSLYGLNQLETISGSLNIANNNTLNNVVAIGNLKTIEGTLTISDNSVLNRLEGLHLVDFSKLDGITIENNPNLSACSVPSICDYLSIVETNVSIQNNNTSCNSPGEITANCPIPDGPCLPEGITFTYQEDLDSFRLKYPNCSEILGSVTVDGVIAYTSYGNIPSMESLQNLHQIKKIHGNLYIETVDSLKNLEGLNQLEYVGGYLQFYGNENLTDISQLSSLKNVGGNLSINSTGLANLNGLESLTQTKWLSINNNRNLTDLSGLQKIQLIDGEFVLDGNLALENLDGLDFVTAINGKVQIINNENLLNVDALSNVSSVKGKIEIANNNNIQSIEGLSNTDYTEITNLILRGNDNLSACSVGSVCDYLSFNGGPYSIDYNLNSCNSAQDILNSCSAFVNTCLLEGIVLTSQEDINNFKINYGNCTKIGGDVLIDGTDGATAITNLNGLSSINSIDGNLTITNCNHSANISGLENLRTLGGSLTLSNLTILNNIEALSNLGYVGGNIVFENNSNLQSIQGLEKLTFVGEDLQISAQAVLTSLEGLNNIKTIQQNLIIEDNPQLLDMSALSRLGLVKNMIKISNNNSLSCINGLDNIYYDDLKQLQILNNINLSECSIWSICNYMNNEGESVIENNATACNSSTEILDNCSIADEPCLSGGITFYLQKDIDEFKINYPNCTEILGDLRIDGIYAGTSDGAIPQITNLRGLSQITSVKGDLAIMGVDSLLNLDGLEHIDSIGERLSISGYLIENLQGIKNVKSVGDDLSISSTAITDFTGLANLNNINGTLYIGRNSNLVSLTGLENLFYEGIETLFIEENPKLTTCAINSVCNFLQQTNNLTILRNNEIDCNTKEAIIANCEITDCEQNININDQFVSSGIFQATNILRSNSEIMPESNIVFKGKTIELSENFEIDKRSNLVIQADPCEN